MHGKAIWKPGIGEIAKASRGNAPQGEGVYSTPYEPPVERSQCADARWVMEDGHKPQSFMKNGGQQNCLDKALGSITLEQFSHTRNRETVVKRW